MCIRDRPGPLPNPPPHLNKTETGTGILSHRGESVLEDEHGFQRPLRNRRRENDNPVLGPLSSRQTNTAPGFCDDRSLRTTVLTLSTRVLGTAAPSEGTDARATARQSRRRRQGAIPLTPAIRAWPNRTALLLRGPELRYRRHCLSESDRKRFYEQSVAGRSPP